MANQKLTQRSLATGVTLNDLIHIVIPTDPTDDPAGSSYKATVGQMMDTISASTIMGLGVGTGSTERCSNLNSAYGNYSTVSGGIYNTSNKDYSTVGGGRVNTSSSYGGTISGGLDNLTGPTGVISTLSSYTSGAGIGLMDGTYGPYTQTTTSGNGVGADFTFDVSGNTITGVTITNGGVDYNNGDTIFITGTTFTLGTSSNDVTITIGNVLVSTFNTVGGGLSNTSSNYNSTVGGGRSNTSSGYDSIIGGGYCNKSSCYFSTVSGGYGNTSSNYSSTVGGGKINTSSGCYSTISGGWSNVSSDCNSTVGGGRQNTSSGCYSTIGGGYSNTILTGGTNSTIGGGYSNTILTGTTNSYIGGGTSNTVSHNCSFILGNGIATTTTGTTFVNQLNIVDLQDGSAGLLAGSVYYCSTDGNRLYFVP